MNFFEIHALQCFIFYSNEPVIGVKNIPIAGSGLDHKTQAQVTESPDEGHSSQCTQVPESIPFREISFIFLQWFYK